MPEAFWNISDIKAENSGEFRDTIGEEGVGIEGILEVHVVWACDSVLMEFWIIEIR